MQKYSFALFCFLIAALVLGLGIASPTGLTGKDEYLLGLRIPLEMMQGDHWWVPFIDGAPRLKKPPLLYWLGRASFELFGPSLLAARAITVAFALLLLGCTAWLGRRLSGHGATGLLAAAVLLGMSGMASESRRLMLDVPVAALSMAALCCYLAWLDRARFITLIGAAGFLSAALLTKGPIAFVVCGGGLVAVWLTQRETLPVLWQRWQAHLLMLALALALPLFWYWQVREHYGAQLAQAAHAEMEARQFGLSADALIGIITLAMPWTFVALHALWSLRREPNGRFLALWLLMTLLPFFFIRSFDRYLIGSLPALALLTAFALEKQLVARWSRILGSLLFTLPVIILIILLWRWQISVFVWLTLALVCLSFIIVWWRRVVNPAHLAISAALLWMVGWGIAFPALGVNQVPENVLALTQDKQVILFDGPQPALLPILQGRPLRQTSDLWPVLDELGGLPFPTRFSDILIAVRAEDLAKLEDQLHPHHYVLSVMPELEYQALTSSGSGIRFAKAGASWEDWKQSWRERSPAPLMSTVQIFSVACCCNTVQWAPTLRDPREDSSKPKNAAP